MAVNKIGIKLADGSFFPIMDAQAGERKKLVLTTTHDYQEKVQIDFYLGDEESTPDELMPIGGMRMEKVEPDEQGKPEVKLYLSVDTQGNLIARAVDDVVGEEESKSYVIPLDGSEALDVGSPFSDDESDYFPSMAMESDFEEDSSFEAEEPKPQPRRGNLVFALGFALIGLFLIAMLSFLFFRQFDRAPQPPLQAEPGVSQTAPDRANSSRSC